MPAMPEKKITSTSLQCIMVRADLVCLLVFISSQCKHTIRLPFYTVPPSPNPAENLKVISLPARLACRWLCNRLKKQLYNHPVPIHLGSYLHHCLLHLYAHPVK